jgi:hypothetical protein
VTILNQATDGLYSQLVTVFRAVVAHGPLEVDELKRICSVGSGVVARWTELGLFDEVGGAIRLAASFSKKRGESLDTLTERLPYVCRHLILDELHCLPLWPTTTEKELTEAGTGRTADFARGMAWTLSQDIYTFPSGGSAENVEAIENEQISSGKFIFLNQTRWPGLRFWARFMGFGTGSDAAFLIDPTVAVHEELPAIFNESRNLTADLFVKELASRLPIFDSGTYRESVEAALDEARWRRPPDGHLSTSLSLALRRLQLDNIIELKTQSDAGQGFALCGRQYRTWGRFTHVEYKGVRP